MSVLAVGLLGACTGPSSAPARAPALAVAPPPKIAWVDAPLGRFRSRALDLTFGLPEPDRWKVSERGPWLSADHPSTRSRLTIGLWFEDRAAGRERCFERAREQRPEIPDLASLSVLADEMRSLARDFDARVVTGLSAEADGSMSGVVAAFGTRGRKCLVFLFRTQGAEADETAGRLALASTRLLQSLEVGTSLDAAPASPAWQAPSHPRAPSERSEP